MPDRASELAEKVWITKGARFNAYRRLKGKHEHSLRATALMSVYVVFLQLAPRYLPAGTVAVEESALTLLTAFMAIAILVLSLVEHSKSYLLQAEHLHNCGMALNALYDDLVNRTGERNERESALLDLDDVSRRYHEILGSIRENHDPIDNELFRAQHREHFKLGVPTVLGIRLRNAIVTYGFAWTLIFGFPIAAVVWVV